MAPWGCRGLVSKWQDKWARGNNTEANCPARSWGQEAQGSTLSCARKGLEVMFRLGGGNTQGDSLYFRVLAKKIQVIGNPGAIKFPVDGKLMGSDTGGPGSHSPVLFTGHIFTSNDVAELRGACLNMWGKKGEPSVEPSWRAACPLRSLAAWNVNNQSQRAVV